MKIPIRKMRGAQVGWLGLLLASAGLCPGQDIPEDEITDLQSELAEAAETSSASAQRRAFKNVVRDGEDLLEASPGADNRFLVLATMFGAQKRVLGFENSDRNRATLFEISEQLAGAPDGLAAVRLEADLLLSERKLSEKSAGVEERAAVLAELIARYRDTPGEAKSLRAGTIIARKLDAFDLEQAILNRVAERFAGDHTMIEWRHQQLGFSQMDVMFTGGYERVDGAALSFPIDRLGHTSLMIFWSEETDGVEARLAEIQSLREQFPDRFEVFSFNVDELPDGGERWLRQRGFDWAVMLLPGGRENSAYRAYAGMDPAVVRVNAHGHAFALTSLSIPLVGDRALNEDDLRNPPATPLAENLDDPRYLAQLQSLLVGDFLVAKLPATEGGQAASPVPEETLSAIQVCFSPPPFRYRLSSEEALENYEKAEQLCTDAIAKHPDAPNLWVVRNRRIIALLGMWNLACEPECLIRAAEEAKTSLASEPPSAGEVVPRFCLAKAQLREDGSDPRPALADLVDAMGGPDAPAPALAAASILALDANSREWHDHYAAALLEVEADNPSPGPVVTLLRDQHHTFRLFKANYYHPPSRARRVVRSRLRSNTAALDGPSDTAGPLVAELKALDGSTLSIPGDTSGKLAFLLLMEPPTDEDAVLRQDTAMKAVAELADTHLRGEIEVIAAFLCEAGEAAALMNSNGWTCPAAIVPDGLGSPLVRRLGVLSADHAANIALLRPDGTIAWTLSGLRHPQLRSEGVGEEMNGVRLGIMANIDVLEMAGSLEQLKAGNFQEAVEHFTGPFPPPERPQLNGWSSPRLHGRALAHVGMKDWEAALADIDAALETHQQVFDHPEDEPCASVFAMHQLRAIILSKLDRKEEAETARGTVNLPPEEHADSRYHRYHRGLSQLQPSVD